MPQRGVIVAVDVRDPRRPLEPELDEFAALIEAAGGEVVERIVQRRAAVDPATLVGEGKAREIAELVRERSADLVFVLNEIRPRQRKNLERIVPAAIVDRTMLILDVFARHARSSEGQLQVELAQLRYRLSNLIGVGADLSRLGGGIGTRGPGEKKLEVDRRRIQRRISALRRRLEVVRRSRAVRRSGRGGEPLVALVGYTNAGKSSLLNALARADAYVADRPFATLDPLVRRARLTPEVTVRLADTVGFITDLPKDLVTAFRATLEELHEAQLLVHVVDASAADHSRRRAAVEAILHDLGLDETPRLLVFNKSDLITAVRPDDEHDVLDPDAVLVSARTGAGLELLRARVAAALERNAAADHEEPDRP